MDAAHRAGAATAFEEWVISGGVSHPAETALVFDFFFVLFGLHDGLLNFFELFEQLIVRLVQH